MDETPTKLFLETSLPTSASPYPSPSSAFYPPPIPASHEFANKLGASLATNKRYRGSGGSHHSAGGPNTGAGGGGVNNQNATTAGGVNGLGSPIGGGNGLGPSSANSSRRGSASAPSPLATHEPHVAHLDEIVGSTSKLDSGSDSTASHDRITTLSNSTGDSTTDSQVPNLPSNTSASDSSTHPTTPNPITATTTLQTSLNPSTPSDPTTPLSHAPPPPSSSNSITPATSKRTSQILEILTPIRAAPPSPGPSRRGSLIRRGSSRRWSRGSGARGASGGDAIAPNVLAGGIGGMAGIGSAWLGGEAVGTTSSTVSEDGSLHSDSGDPTSNSPTAATTATTAASKRASRRLSAFNALASTTEGEVVSFSEHIANEDVYLSPSAPSPSVVETETEPVTPATPADAAATGEETIVQPGGGGAEQGSTGTTGTSALKPILVLDFAFPDSDPRHTKRPLELLSKLERSALTPEERAGYAKGKKKEDEWDEAAEEDGEEEDGEGWGWIGVSGLRPVRREGGGYEEEEEEDGEEMTPRFGYGYSHDNSTPTDGTPNTHNTYNGLNGGGGGGGYVDGEDEMDPDSPLPPGIYRALYAFEAEGTAEMSLSEGQLVRVVGRGGGVGWAVVERGWRPENSGGALGGGSDGLGNSLDVGGGAGDAKGTELDAGLGTEESSGALGMAGQALVPEGYLEIWMLDGEEWGGRDVDEF